jgi:SAM-dependent methyltransferase
MEGYWEARGRAAAADELDAVCYAGAPDFLNRYADWSQRRTVQALLDAVGPLEGARALDVGTGTGRWARVLAARGASVVGVDLSEPMLAEARRRSAGLDFRQMSATELAFDDDEFDLAVVVTVLQHLPHADQERALAELVRVVRPGRHIVTVDRVGTSTPFTEAHGTYPRRRDEWQRAWRAAGAEPVSVRGQEFSYPLRLAELGRPPSLPQPGEASEPSRRGSAGWRRAVLRGLVAASYLTEAVASHVPRAPAQHLAVVLCVGATPLR